METKVLITGASGLVGARLTNLLIAKGYAVNLLGRKKIKHVRANSFVWNIERNEVDEEAFKGVDHIVHLAGASVADGRWTVKRKKLIIDSRVKSAELLYNTLERINNNVETFISASGVGYYGQGQGSTFAEDDPVADDFLGTTCKFWEEAADKMAELGYRVVKLRIGVVLSEKGGALQKMIKPIKAGIGSPLGTGLQAMPWIHIDDLIGFITKVIGDYNVFGAFNMASPNQVNNQDFMRQIAKVCGRKIFMPKVPSFALRLFLGEMASIVLSGNYVNVDRLLHTGYEFRYPVLDDALRNLLVDNK